jgi:hypothetical protein
VPEAVGELERQEHLEGGTDVGVVIAGAGAAVSANFVGYHSHSWRTKHFALLVVLEEVVVVGHSTEDCIELLLGVVVVVVVDVQQQQQPSKLNSPVVLVVVVEDLEAKGVAGVCN